MTFRFADIEILRYRVHDWESLPLPLKQYLYHLSEATLWGRDIIFAQHHGYAVAARVLVDALVQNETEKNSSDYLGLVEYARRLWFASGFYHHYSERKFCPSCSEEYLFAAADRLPQEFQERFRAEGVDIHSLIRFLCDPDIDPVRRASDGDPLTLIERSSVAFYAPGVTTAAAKTFYEHLADEGATPLAPGLNSRLELNARGELVEIPASLSGLYAPALKKIVQHLRVAQECAPTTEAAALLEHLIQYYTTGDLLSFYLFSVEWVAYHCAQGSDFINGFIETYTDPLGLKGSWEGIVQLRDKQGSLRTQIVAEQASHFEALSPILPEHRKGKISGVSAQAINVVMLGGDSYPASPLGINLPNDERIRAQYGSKSVTLTNISEALEESSQTSGALEAFYLDKIVQERIRKYGAITSLLHTDLHECLGHGSGKLMPGVAGDSLGSYDSTIEEARADLNALYFIADPEMVTLGLLPDLEAYKAEYDRFITNGAITQLARIESGAVITQAHMQERAMISRYLLDHNPASVIELLHHEEHYYVRIHDYEALRQSIAELLCEVQRIKSTGDQRAARTLIECYGVHVPTEIHESARKRYHDLGIAPYRGFLNPRITPQLQDNNIVDYTIDYGEEYDAQMLRYGVSYASLPLLPYQHTQHPDGVWRDTLNSLRRQFRRAMDGVVASSMRDKGIKYRVNFGVTLPKLREIAQTLPKDASLARLMWSKDVREMRLLATMIWPSSLTQEEAYELCCSAQHIEESEQLVQNLLVSFPFAGLLTLQLWHHHHDYTKQASIIPYIMITRMIMQRDAAAYQLLPILMEQAEKHLDTPPGSLLLYLVNALSRMADGNERERRLFNEFMQKHQAHEGALITALRSFYLS